MLFRSSTLQPNSSLNAHFYQPGDQIEYTLTITNKSTVTAAIKSILVDNESVTSNTTKKKNNITYIVEMPETTTLAPNASTTMKVIARFQNETDISGNVSGQTETIEVKINAEQDDGTGGFTPTAAKFTGSIYRYNSVQATVGDTIKSETKNVWCGLGTDPYGNTYSSCDGNQGYESDEECRASGWNNCEQGTITTGIGDYTEDSSTLGKDVYIKHDVVDDIITSSYVCFVYNNGEHCMKGGGGGASFETTTQIIKEYQTFYNLGDYSNGVGCYFNSSEALCTGGKFNQVIATQDGGISVYHSNESCYITKCN